MNEKRGAVKGKLWISFQSKLNSSLVALLKTLSALALKVPIVRFNILPYDYVCFSLKAVTYTLF